MKEIKYKELSPEYRKLLDSAEAAMQNGYAP